MQKNVSKCEFLPHVALDNWQKYFYYVMYFNHDVWNYSCCFGTLAIFSERIVKNAHKNLSIKISHVNDNGIQGFYF